ncbi:hypothetical protein Glove_14g20 [Diversispora epigaea]|uniref:Uncharacterized protein n=1 Tax=Diversispora epigaea TaxID=1348612 RepID=A0A397JNG3_9GLOM|nr:hypothetical protein Glove_14g20 [Diversispora epigaea]
MLLSKSKAKNQLAFTVLSVHLLETGDHISIISNVKESHEQVHATDIKESHEQVGNAAEESHKQVVDVENDLGNRRACKDLVRKKLKEGKNVIVDRVNFDKNQRKNLDRNNMEFRWIPPRRSIKARKTTQQKFKVKNVLKLTNLKDEHKESIERIIKIKPQPYNRQVIIKH